LKDASALGALEAAGAATASAERTLALPAVGTMSGVTAGPLGMALTLLGTLALRGTLPVVPLCIIAAALSGWLDRRAGSRRPAMTMAIVTALATESAAAAATLLALGGRQL
jgi:hypothetical protein